MNTHLFHLSRSFFINFTYSKRQVYHKRSSCTFLTFNLNSSIHDRNKVFGYRHPQASTAIFSGNSIIRLLKRFV